MDLVSVIIPFYRGKEWLITALQSVVSQTYKELEIIVIDDGSGIDIDDLIDRFPKMKVIHKENGGPASARNLGISCAKGKYVAFLDSDDIWLENKLKEQIEFMKSKGYSWSATAYTKFQDGQENFTDKDIRIKLKEKSDMPLWQMLSSTRIATPTVIIEKQFLDENEDVRFIEGLRFAEDTCFWFSMAIESRFGYLETPLSRVRVHGSNAAGSCYTQIIARSDIYDFLKKTYKNIVEKMPPILKLGYFITQKEKMILIRLKSNKNVNWIAKTLYVIPWAIFQASSAIYGGKK